MTERNVIVRQLLEILPDRIEFDPLRQALRQASMEDPAQQWSGTLAYRTVDRRVIATSAIGGVLNQAEASVRQRVKRLYEGATLAFSAVTSGRAEEKAEMLVAWGEAAESFEQWEDAYAYYLLAEGTARYSTNLRLRALLLRRVGRSALNVGDFARSRHFYFASLNTASTESDAEGQLVAATGLGNIASLQGRWSEAEDWYAKGLQLSGSGFPREHGQLLVNRSMAAREMGLLAEAHAYLDDAREHWYDLTSADQAGWFNNHGLLLMMEQNLDGAAESFVKALDGEPGHFHRAMVLDNLAEVAILHGDLDLAERYCRDAEEQAVAHGSPRALAEVYIRLGRLAAARHDPNGVSFFDKALELTEGRQYPLLIAEIHYEYGRFRKALHEPQAARVLFDRAIQLFAELGAMNEVALTQKEI